MAKVRVFVVYEDDDSLPIGLMLNATCSQVVFSLQRAKEVRDDLDTAIQEWERWQKNRGKAQPAT